MRTRRLARLFALGLLTLMTLGLVAGPAGAQTLDEVRDRDRRIAVGNSVLLEGERIDGPVVAIDGNAVVDGRTDSGVLAVSGNATVGSTGVVDGDVYVIDGNARVSGRITGDVIVVSGRADIRDGATVNGDVRSTKQPVVDRGARVKGETEHTDFAGTFTAFGIRFLGLFWLAVTVSTALLGLLLLLLFPRATQSTGRAGRGSVGKSIGVGVLVAIGLPVVAVIALATFVGIPFGLGLMGALGLFHALGYVAGAYCFGRILVKEPRSALGAFFAGWGILRAVALIPGLGVLVWIAASVWGIGALTVAAWRGGRGALEPPPEPKTPAVPPASTAPDAAATDTGTGTDAPDTTDAEEATADAEPTSSSSPSSS
jgi:cytoskeletal protein CcmA (bactofilin family)